MFIQNGLQINDKKKYLNWIMRKILFKLILKKRRRFSNEILKHVTEWVNGLLLCQHNVSYCAFDWLASEMRHFNGDWLDDTSDDDLGVLLSVCVELQVRDEISHCSDWGTLVFSDYLQNRFNFGCNSQRNICISVNLFKFSMIIESKKQSHIYLHSCNSKRLVFFFLLWNKICSS